MSGSAKISVLVVDDHRMVRAGIRDILLLSGASVKWQVDEAESTEVALERADKGNYDVILMDFWIPALNGPRATELILRKNPWACVLGLSAYGERSYAERMVQAGARGFILKNVEPETLLTAIKSVMNGKQYFSGEVVPQTKKKHAGVDQALQGKLLTPREREVLGHVLSGLRSREIAKCLFISKRTVDVHREHIMAKLGVQTTAGLVVAAMAMGLLGCGSLLGGGFI